MDFLDIIFNRKKIIIWANSFSTGVFDEEDNILNWEDTNISKETWKDLQSWVHEYEKYTSISENDINNMREKINELDNLGTELMKKIKNEWKHDLKTGVELQFVYRSEILGDFF